MSPIKRITKKKPRGVPKMSRPAVIMETENAEMVTEHEMNDEHIDEVESQTKKAGRPKKKSKVSINTGRKPVHMGNASRSSKYRRAQAAIDLCNNDIETLKLALNLAKKNDPDSLADSEKDEKQEDRTPKRHTKESALNFYLSNNYSKKT